MASSPGHRARILATLVTVTLAFTGCGDDGGPGVDASTSLRTLDTCATSIAADAPAFYRRYFRCVTVTTTATGVTIATEGLPPHPSPYYDEDHANYTAFDTRGGTHRRNPNTLAAQALTVNIPSAPTPSGATITAATVDGQAGTSQEEYRGLPAAGIALDSVVLFTGTAAPGDDIAEERFTFDRHEGHPQNTGVYHYHSPTPGPLEALRAAGETTSIVPGAAEVELYGIMCDGTVILGCTELDGAAPAGGLDAQGGHVGDLRAADDTLFFTARYHTHVCAGARDYTPEIHYYATCVR